MEITKEQFFAVGKGANISSDNLDLFWHGLEQKSAEQGPVNNSFALWLYYFGALIVISAMTFFMTITWEIFGGGGLFAIAAIYALLFTWLGARSWNKPGLRVPAGLFVTIAVCMVPLAIYGLETQFGIWPGEYPGEYIDFYTWIQGSWIFMEIATILAGLLALYFFPFPFLTAPIAFAAWFLMMDIVPAVFGKEASIDTRAWVSIAFGVAMLGIGLALDRKYKADFGFWSYLFGSLSLWGGINVLAWQRGHMILFIYLLINILLMCLAVLLRRNILMILGAIGVFSYLTYLTSTIFAGAVLFPFVLSLIGLLTIYLGIQYQRNQVAIEHWLIDCVPKGLRGYLRP